QPFQILVAPRCFTDKHDGRVRIAVGENRVLGSEFQVATVEGLQLPPQLIERAGAGGHFPGECGLRLVRDGCLWAPGAIRLWRGCPGRGPGCGWLAWRWQFGGLREAVDSIVRKRCVDAG